MLLYHTECLCYGILPFLFIAVACAGYAYYANAQRPPDDPQKRSCHLISVVLTPITLPLVGVLHIAMFFMRVLFYGVFLILFAIALIVVRESFLLQWLHKIATYIGNQVLDANTIVGKPFRSSAKEQAKIIRSTYQVDPSLRRLI